MQKNLNTFSDRLLFLLGDRDKHPWGNRVGIGRGTITNMFDGKVPGYEVLNAISRFENVSITWLVDGRGSPFLTHQCTTDEQAAEVLDELLYEGGWVINLLTDHGRIAVVLTQPGQYELKGTMIDYTIIEVVVGACGRRLLDRVWHAIPVHTVYLASTHEDVMDSIATGHCGRYFLLDLPESPMADKKQIKSDHPIFNWPEAGEPLTYDEHKLIENYRLMTEQTRSSYKTIGAALAQQGTDHAKKTG